MTEIDATIETTFGPPPDGIDLTESIVVEYDIVSCAVLGLATAAVGLRFYIRTKHNTGTKMLGSDDYTILFGLISTGALVATSLVGGKKGAGTHLWSLSVNQLMELIKVVFVEPWIYAAAVTSTKISILLLYRRLFYISENKMIATDRLFAIMFWTACFLTCTYPIIMWTVMACACRPLSFYWKQYAGATGGYCIDTLRFYLIFGIINMVNDIIILTVPIPRIMKLHMNTQKKVSIAGIMLLGSFVCVASVVRIYYLKRLTVETDVTWTLGPAFAWSNLEPSVAIISACLPTFAPLFRGLRNKGSANSLKNKNASSSGYLSNGHVRLQDYSQQTPSNFRIEDDEVQLTGKNAHRDNFEIDDHTITVKTQIDVVTTEQR